MWQCVTYLLLFDTPNLTPVCCRWCFVVGRGLCRCSLLWSMSSRRPDSIWSSTISDKVWCHDVPVFWRKENRKIFFLSPKLEMCYFDKEVITLPKLVFCFLVLFHFFCFFGLPVSGPQFEKYRSEFFFGKFLMVTFLVGCFFFSFFISRITPKQLDRFQAWWEDGLRKSPLNSVVNIRL